jgi:hypothetical protein
MGLAGGILQEPGTRTTLTTVLNALSGKRTLAAPTTRVAAETLENLRNPVDNPRISFVVESNLLRRRAASQTFQRLLQHARLPAMTRWPLKALQFCLAVALFLPELGMARAAAQTQVDLELVIAVDVSLSMDLDEQRLQRDGYVAAFRDAEVHKAITSGPFGRIAVAYVEWAGHGTQQVVVPWTLVDGPQTAQALADRLENTPITRARMTSISSALDFSGGLFDTSGVRGIRRVVDVSGDGPNNSGRPVLHARDELVAKGIVINGLPILLKTPSGFFDIPDLDRYYTDCVIGGTGSFMIPIKERREFQTATRRKLLLEISALEPAARLIRVQDQPTRETSDCMVGERQWRRYLEGGPN